MDDKLIRTIKKLKNQKAKLWRDKNKDKVKASNERYWINLAKRELEKEAKKGEQ